KNSIAKIHALIQEITGQSLAPSDWAPTPNRDLGDFAIPCFKLSKALGKSPAQAAQDLVPKLEEKLREQSNEIFSQVQASGPYINVFQNTAFLYKTLRAEMEQDPETFGSLGI